MAPTEVHQERVVTLRTLAALAGCTCVVGLGGQTFPDVVLADMENLRLFVGDAKATESAGCYATRCRLVDYTGRLVAWVRSGFAVRFVVCVPAQDEIAALRWRELLETACRIGGLDTEPLPCAELMEGEWVVSVASGKVGGKSLAAR
jgi:hypothetical protein